MEKYAGKDTPDELAHCFMKTTGEQLGGLSLR